jgi:HEPN domain-containing protein
MKPPPRAEAERWLAQAKSDLDFARLGLREGFFAQACFQCQQAAEKALKALHYFGGARFVPGHSLVELLAPVMALDPSLTSLQEAARRLDQLYIPTRYPNGLPGGVPAQVFSHGQAAEAIAQATTFLERAGATIG